MGRHPPLSAYMGSASRGWADPPSRDTWDTTGYGQQAGGTHPTEVLSCLVVLFLPKLHDMNEIELGVPP